jgi:hypothetical protein
VSLAGGASRTLCPTFATVRTASGGGPGAASILALEFAADVPVSCTRIVDAQCLLLGKGAAGSGQLLTSQLVGARCAVAFPPALPPPSLTLLSSAWVALATPPTCANAVVPSYLFGHGRFTNSSAPAATTQTVDAFVALDALGYALWIPGARRLERQCAVSAAFVGDVTWALTVTTPAAGGEAIYDTRLFNQTSGVGGGLGAEEGETLPLTRPGRVSPLPPHSPTLPPTHPAAQRRLQRVLQAVALRRRRSGGGIPPARVRRRRALR